MALGSATLQTGSVTASATSMLVGGLVFSESTSFSAPASWTGISNGTGTTADQGTARRQLSSGGSYNGVFGFSGGTPLTWSSAGAVIALKEASSFNPKKSSAFMEFF